MLGSFILGTARNIILETLRSPFRAALEQHEIPDRPAPADDIAGLDEAVSGAIEATLRRLKRREQEVLRLAFYDDLSKEEIGRRLGVDGERVRLIKSRALKSFRELYQRAQKIVDTKGGGSSHKV